MTKHKHCLICNSDKLKKLPRYYERHQLVQCQSCGLAFMENIPTLDELNNYYSQYSYAADDTGYFSPITVQNYNKLLDEFERFRKTNKMLDIGCGRGWFLIEAQKRGWEVYGTEYSQEAIKICESNGLKMKAGKLESDTFEPGEFDVITSFEVMEHINNPVEEVRNIHKFLRKGGMFYLTTPNYNAYLRYNFKEEYDIFVYPEHLTFYSKSTIKKLLTENGFKSYKILTTGISLSRQRPLKDSYNEERLISEKSSDEQLRQTISNKWYLGYAKNVANKVLTVLGVGLSLKGYFIKI